MCKLKTALKAWISFHAKIGGNVEATLMPAATESEIQAIEGEIGFRLPDDLRELYKIANGQFDPYNHDEQLNRRLQPGQAWTPLFGNYTFLPLDRAVAVYNDTLDWTKSEREFAQEYNRANPDQALDTNIWQVRRGDAVDPLGWNPSWFAFADSDDNSYSVDMNPPHGGTPGQVVEQGSDVGRLSVVASSLTDLMQDAALRLDPAQDGRYQRSDPTSERPATIYFDMDWRNQPHEEHGHQSSIPEVPDAFQIWVQEAEVLRERELRRFVAWLQKRHLSERDITDIQAFVDTDLHAGHMPMPPRRVIEAMQAMAVSQGQRLNESPVRDEKTLEQVRWYRYYAALAVAVVTGHSVHGKHLSSTIGQGIERQQAVSLYHRYMLESGKWTQFDHDLAEGLRARFEKLQLIEQGQADVFAVQLDESMLSILYTAFDRYSDQAEDHCETIDLAEYRH